MAVTLDRVVVWIPAVTLHPHVVDHTVVSELNPPPPVVFPVEPGVTIVARETIVDALEVRDVVAGQGQAEQWETRPSRRIVRPVVRCPRGCQPNHGQRHHQAPLSPVSIAAHLTPVTA